MDSENDAGDSDFVTELGNLIERASRANHGRSMHQAAELATKRGAPISKSLISKVARKVETLTPLIIKGIAAGYDVSEEDVIRAALADLGFPIADYAVSPESALLRDPELSTDSRTVLLGALQAARGLAGSADDAKAGTGLTRLKGQVKRVRVKESDHRSNKRG